MDNDQLRSIGTALANVAAVIAERRRQLGQGATSPFAFVGECIDQEVARLRSASQAKLADSLAALRSEIEGMGNE